MWRKGIRSLKIYDILFHDIDKVQELDAVAYLDLSQSGNIFYYSILVFRDGFTVDFYFLLYWWNQIQNYIDRKYIGLLTNPFQTPAVA